VTAAQKIGRSPDAGTYLAATGCKSPVDHEEAVVKIEESIVIERAPEDAFAFFEDRANDRRWISSVIESRWLHPDETTGVGRRGTAVMNVMGRREFNDEVTRFEPGRLVEHRQVSGPVVMDTACIAERHDAGCRVTVTYVPKHFPGGVLGWLAAPFAARAVRRMYRADLARLKTILEAEAGTAN
jgi:uncharacterized membrane protein